MNAGTDTVMGDVSLTDTVTSRAVDGATDTRTLIRNPFTKLRTSPTRYAAAASSSLLP